VAPSVQRRKVWLTPTTRVPCSNAAKTRNPLKFAGVPQTRQQILAVSRPKFNIIMRTCGRGISVFNKFFFRLSIYALAANIYNCAMVPKWRFLRPVFQRAACSTFETCILIDKFALRPHHVWKHGRHPISNR